MQICGPSGPHRPRERRKSPNIGMTLVEVMMAFFVLTTAVVSCLYAVQKTFVSLDTARCSTLAAQIMQSEVETLRLKNWAQINALANGTAKTFTVAELRELVPTGSSELADRFTMVQTISPLSGYVDSAGKTTMIEIALSVTWSGHGQTPNSRAFVARYAKEGLYNYYATAR